MKKNNATNYKLDMRMYLMNLHVLSPRQAGISRAVIERPESFICCPQTIDEWGRWMEGSSPWTIDDCTHSWMTLSPVSRSKTYECGPWFD